MNGDLALTDDDTFGDAFYDSALLLRAQVFPSGVEVLSLRQYLVAGEELNSQEVNFCLKLGELFFDLV